MARNLYTTKRLSAWTSAVEHRCLGCDETFRSEHAAAFHDCKHVGPVDFLKLYPLIETLVLDMRAKAEGAITTDECLHSIHRTFLRLGPYEFAKINNLLVDNSGLEFATQFMGAYNRLVPGTY